MDEDQLNNQSGQDQAVDAAATPEAAEEKGSRLDAAKAFFRALSAGEEASPADFGMGQPQSEAAAPAQAAGPCRNCAALESQLADQEKKTGETEGLYKRMAADFENYRRRIDREREEFQGVGAQKVVETLLPALDDMDRALSSLSAEMAPDKLLESLRLVYNRINRCMEQIGVKPMAAVGEHFDPKYHEPVQEVETTEFPDGSVMHELRKGYTLNDKVIRPALVNVASNSGGKTTSEPETGSDTKADDVATDEKGGKVYDLSEFENADEDTPAVILEKNMETPTAGNRVLDE